MSAVIVKALKKMPLDALGEMPVSCEPSTAGSFAVPSNWTRLLALVPAVNVAAEPKPKLVLAVEAEARSERLLAFCAAPVIRLSSPAANVLAVVPTG